MLNVSFVCWLMNVFVFSTWLKHRVLVPDKHGGHFSVLEGILSFSTLPFSIRMLPIIFCRFLLLLKVLIGCSWKNSHRFLLVWRMCQFQRTIAVRFDKNWLHVNINGICFGSCCSWSFSCSRSSLTSLSTFSNCSSTSFCSWPCLKNHSFSSHEWWSKSFLVEQILFIWIAWLYGMLFFNDFGCSELMLRKVWLSVFFLNIWVCNLLFLMYISVFQN